MVTKNKKLQVFLNGKKSLLLMEYPILLSLFLEETKRWGTFKKRSYWQSVLHHIFQLYLLTDNALALEKLFGIHKLNESLIKSGVVLHDCGERPKFKGKFDTPDTEKIGNNKKKRKILERKGFYRIISKISLPEPYKRTIVQSMKKAYELQYRKTIDGMYFRGLEILAYLQHGEFEIKTGNNEYKEILRRSHQTMLKYCKTFKSFEILYAEIKPKIEKILEN
ncbi:MAG: hypothetical protein HY973_02245 [Candidatus Kerfeldbacteria bacterium]|nr:hypothetical protein [Candidatus Kerfeldbacteria bacterium]